MIDLDMPTRGKFGELIFAQPRGFHKRPAGVVETDD
jgi:hypothetical protein